jgi:hypothetical protein
VPENRSSAESRSIEVLVVQSWLGLDGEAPDPLIVSLAGRPDDDFFDQVAWFANTPAARTTQHLPPAACGSQPSRLSLACPSAADSTDQTQRVRRSCASRKGSIPAGCTLDSAAPTTVVDLAQTLAAESINLLGDDIGQRVARTGGRARGQGPCAALRWKAHCLRGPTVRCAGD